MSTSSRIALLLFIGVSLIYVSISRGVFLYGDDILVWQVTEAIVERGAVDVRSPHAEGDVARSNPGRDGRGYAKYGLGLSLVAIPSYVVSDLVAPFMPLPVIDDGFGNRRAGPLIYGTALVNAPIGGAVTALMFLLGLECGFRRRTALVVALLVAIASLLPHYAATFLSEPLSALCLVAVVYALARARSVTGRTRYAWLALSGFAAGLALATKAANGVALIAPGLWLLWLAWGWMRPAWRPAAQAIVAWCLPVGLWVVVIGWYNWQRFGSVLETGYHGEANLYTTPLLKGMYGLLLSPGKGAMWYVPPLWLAAFGMIPFLRRRPGVGLTVLGMAVATMLLYSRFYIWWGGGVWGPRFLVPMLPLLILPAGELIERARGRRHWASWAIAAVALSGVLVTALGILVPFDIYHGQVLGEFSNFEDSLWSVGDSPILAHARLLTESAASPDLAAFRYDSTSVALLSFLAGVTGAFVVGWSCVQVFRSESD